MRRAAAAGLAVALAATLVGCAGTRPDRATPPSPDPAPDTAMLTVDWGERTVTGDSGGLDVAFCEGEGPFLCVSRGGSVLGSVEHLAFDIATMDELRSALDDGASTLDALERHAATQVDAVARDRREGCGPDHVVTADPNQTLTIGGSPALRSGWSARRDGEVVERTVSWTTVMDGTLHVLVAAGLADEGCIERLGEFTVEGLEAALPTLDLVARGSRFPRGDAAPPADERVVTARLVAVDAAGRTMTFVELEVLTGEDANDAAVEAGAISPGEDVPNDYWLREVDAGEVRLPIDPAASVAVQDCTYGCRPVAVELADFLRAVEGGGTGGSGVLELTIAGGRITRVVELFFP
jgi:hypothetical protein